ncbi:MAG: hypothetical protein ACREYE_21325, partial [Gammaproteobacteria bacterium]
TIRTNLRSDSTCYPPYAETSWEEPSRLTTTERGDLRELDTHFLRYCYRVWAQTNAADLRRLIDQ